MALHAYARTMPNAAAATATNAGRTAERVPALADCVVDALLDEALPVEDAEPEPVEDALMLLEAEVDAAAAPGTPEGVADAGG